MPHPVVSRSFLLRMRNVSDESCGDAHLMFNYFFLGNRALYEIKGKIWYNQTGHRQCNTAHALCMLDN